MPVPFTLPPWLTPPDAVATYQHGVQIGASIGAQQAQQRMAEQTAARQQQEMEMQNARWEAEMGIKAAEAALRTQANLRYKARVTAGEDPLKVMMEEPETWHEASAGMAGMYRAQQTADVAKNFVPRIVKVGEHELIETHPNVYINAPESAAIKAQAQEEARKERLQEQRDATVEQLKVKQKFTQLMSMLKDANSRILPFTPKEGSSLAKQQSVALFQKQQILNQLSEITDVDPAELDAQAGSVIGGASTGGALTLPPGTKVIRR